VIIYLTLEKQKKVKNSYQRDDLLLVRGQLRWSAFQSDLKKGENFKPVTHEEAQYFKRYHLKHIRRLKYTVEKKLFRQIIVKSWSD